jgi:hypothetical protein
MYTDQRRSIRLHPLQTSASYIMNFQQWIGPEESIVDRKKLYRVRVQDAGT